MALNKDRLGTAIKTAIALLTDEQKSDIEIVWQAIAECIIDEFVDNGVVTIEIEGDTYTGEIS